MAGAARTLLCLHTGRWPINLGLSPSSDTAGGIEEATLYSADNPCPYSKVCVLNACLIGEATRSSRPDQCRIRRLQAR